MKDQEVFAIILSPTRELAHQIATILETFVKHIKEDLPMETQKLAVWRLTGGTSDEDDVKFMRDVGTSIIVATPGRLEETLKRNPSLRLGMLEMLILDEADRLLNESFMPSIKYITSRLPKQRRTGLFSATMTKRVGELLRAGMRNPIKIVVKVDSKKSSDSRASKDTQVTPLSLSNYYVLVEADAKFSFLAQFLKRTCVDKKVIIYFATIASVKYFRKLIAHFQVVPTETPVLATHSDVPQKKREHIRQTFTVTRSAVLLSTDVTARGVDFPDVDWVVQFDAPKEPDDFVHRSGRTARNGRSGNALLFLLPSEESYVDFMESKGVPLAEFPETSDLPFVSASPIVVASEASETGIDPPEQADKSSTYDSPADKSSSETTMEEQNVATQTRRPLVLARPTPVAQTASSFLSATKDTKLSESTHTHPYLKGMVDFSPKLRRLSLSDRECMDAGLYAFISFVAAYKEHRANFSFRISQLDFGALAKLFGLLKLPRMQEFTASKITNFDSVDVDLETVKYTDKKREKQRQEKIAREEAQKEEREKKKKPKTGAFSAEDFGKTSEDEANEESEKEEDSSSSSEEADFSSEAALLKKLKKKKITEEEYDRLTGNDGIEEEVVAAIKANKSAGPNTKKRAANGKIQQPKDAKKFKRK